MPEDDFAGGVGRAAAARQGLPAGLLGEGPHSDRQIRRRRWRDVVGGADPLGDVRKSDDPVIERGKLPRTSQQSVAILGVHMWGRLTAMNIPPDLTPRCTF